MFRDVALQCGSLLEGEITFEVRDQKVRQAVGVGHSLGREVALQRFLFSERNGAVGHFRQCNQCGLAIGLRMFVEVALQFFLLPVGKVLFQARHKEVVQACGIRLTGGRIGFPQQFLQREFHIATAYAGQADQGYRQVRVVHEEAIEQCLLRRGEAAFQAVQQPSLVCVPVQFHSTFSKLPM